MPLQGHVLALAFSVLFNDLVSRRKAAIQKAMAVLVFTIERPIAKICDTNTKI